MTITTPRWYRHDAMEHGRGHPVGRRGGVAVGIDLVDHAHSRGHLTEQGVARSQGLALGPSTMKNWLPLVLGPEVAMATE